MRLLTAFAFALSLVGPVATCHADDASRFAVARRVVEASRAADNIRSVMPLLVAQMKKNMEQQPLADPKQIDVFVERVQQRFESGIPDFLDLVAHVYAREFSEDDLSALLAFYQSPTGQHFVAKQGEIGKAMLGVGQQWGKTIAGQVLVEMRNEKANPPPKL